MSKLTLVLFAFLLSNQALGQETIELRELKAQVEKLENLAKELKTRIVKLEEEKMNPAIPLVPLAVKTEVKSQDSPNSKLVLSGKAYFGYLEGFRKETPGTFDLFRGYFGGSYQISPRVSLKFTTDMAAKRLNGNGPFSVVLKKMFLDYQFSKNHRLMIGQIDLPWVVNCEDIQGFRFIGKCFSEEEGFYSSADLGIGLKGRFRNGILNYHFDFVNGNNWTAPETNRSKDFHALITLVPFMRSGSWQKGIFASVGGANKNYSRDELRPGETPAGYRFDAMAGYNMGNLTITFESIRTKDPASKAEKFQPGVSGLNAFIHGYSTFIHFRPNIGTKNLGWLARVDSLNPTRAVERDSHTRFIAGPSWRVNSNLQLWSGYWGIRFQENAQVKIKKQNFLGFFAEAKF